MDSPVTYTRGASLGRVAITYAVAGGAGAGWLLVGPDSGRRWLDALIADLLATAVVFVASRLYRNSSFYDAYWSVAPPLIFLYWWSFGPLGADDVRCWLVMIVMTLWSVRLTLNWAVGWPGLEHEDWRYPLLRAKAGRAEILVDLFAIHLFPTLQVFLALAPLFLVTRAVARPFGVLDVVAFAIGLAAVALETVADLQMRAFVREGRRGQAMDRGLWAWSRHPNYFGEFGFWVSCALFAVAAAPGHAWWIFAGALGMLAMFYGASIPMMEERSLARRPDYQRVIDTVPRFVPRPPRSSRQSPA